MGTSLAWSLLARGHEVILIEPGRVASGTTSSSYAWLNSHKKHPETYHALNLAGLRHWACQVAPQYPGAAELNGHLEYALEDGHRADLKHRVERLRSLEYPARWVTPEHARSLTPAKVPENALIAFFPEEGHCYPEQLSHTKVAEMQQSPAFSFVRDPVRSIDSVQGRVELRSGAHLSGDIVVLAAGNATTELAATAGIDIPMIPAAVGGAAYGYLCCVRVDNHGIRMPLTTDVLSIRPWGNDRLLLQALDLDETADPSRPPVAKIVDEFLTRLRVVLPHTEAHLEEIRVGHRVIPQDGFTVAGPASDDPGNRLWIVVTHSGVVLGPWLAEGVAEEITTGEPNPLNENFRPTRFCAPRDTSEYTAPRRPGDQ